MCWYKHLLTFVLMLGMALLAFFPDTFVYIVVLRYNKAQAFILNTKFYNRNGSRYNNQRDIDLSASYL